MPLSFEQIEEHSNTLSGSSPSKATNSGKTYRDSAGRLRIEPEAAKIILISDPTINVQFILIPSQQLAYRWPIPSAALAQITFFSGNALDPSLKWTTITEELGAHVIAGIECTGSRIVNTAEGNPKRLQRTEEWYSDKLKLMAMIRESNPQESHTIEIRNPQFGEPDPDLFKVPTAYSIKDLKSEVQP